MELPKMKEFAKKYTEAWSSQDPASVASFFSPNGSLQINQNPPSVGREALTATAQSFMTDLPDMVLTMDELSGSGDRYVYRWILRGTNTGPGGSGNSVHISGYEEWTIGPDGLILESIGHMDEEEYQLQLRAGSQ